MAQRILIRLPYPPSVNTYWRHTVIGRSVRVLISKRGREYRQAVQAAAIDAGLFGFDMLGRIAVTIEAYQPDRRQRDIDNLPKGVLDGLTHSKIWRDDSQIDKLVIVRCGVAPPGRVDVSISRIG